MAAALSEMLLGTVAVPLTVWQTRMPVNPEAKARTFPLLNTLAALKSLGQAFLLAKRLPVSPTGMPAGQMTHKMAGILPRTQSEILTAVMAASHVRTLANPEA
ncbi:hypothetical protein [Amycolatopsis sp. NPDC051903]|uniref:hypothetical protein n=1 Tax=Amycolatopsis sp. NPDC051903 TaxID=3363936 RepID=UPI00379DEEDA